MTVKNKILIREPEGFKWLVMCIINEKIERAVYSDLTDACELIGTSKSTMQRRLRVNDQVKINGYQVIKIPYFKSNRGKEHINGKHVMDSQLETIINKELI